MKKENEKKIKYDFFRYYGGRTRRFKVLAHPGARFMYIFRNCQRFSKNNPLGIFFRVWLQLISVKYNVSIPHTTCIGKGLYLGHFQNIIINENAIIGENCNIMQGVTIGNESRGRRLGAPAIGDKVVIGPNSVITGKISIGNNVLIGPLTFVNFDIPNDSVVLGNPAKILKSGNGSSGYIKWVLEDK